MFGLFVNLIPPPGRNSLLKPGWLEEKIQAHLLAGGAVEGRVCRRKSCLSSRSRCRALFWFIPWILPWVPRLVWPSWLPKDVCERSRSRFVLCHGRSFFRDERIDVMCAPCQFIGIDISSGTYEHRRIDQLTFVPTTTASRYRLE
jgi:hypothetical protein